MHEIQVLRASLMRALKKLESELDDLQLDQLTSLAKNANVQAEIERLFNIKDPLFAKTKGLLNRMHFDAMQQLEEQLRAFALGLHKLTTSVRAGIALELQDLKFYKGLVEFTKTTSKTPWNESLNAWADRHRFVLKIAAGAIGTLLTILLALFASGSK